MSKTRIKDLTGDNKKKIDAIIEQTDAMLATGPSIESINADMMKVEQHAKIFQKQAKKPTWASLFCCCRRGKNAEESPLISRKTKSR